MRRLPPLASLRAFEAAARHLSFKEAAGELGVTPTAISHQVRLLEDTLGVKLFERRTRHVVMTEAAQRLFPALRDGFDRIADAVERTRADPDRPAVVVTATAAFAAHWLVPRLPAFRDRHPDTALSILASDEIVSLEAGRADIAIRLGGAPEPAVETRTLFRDRFAPLASPVLGIATPEDLTKAPVIRFEWHRAGRDRPDWPQWLAAAGLGHLHMEPTLRFNEESHALHALISGQGIALFSLTIAADAIARDLLVQPFATTIPGQSYDLVRLRSEGHRPAVDAVWDWLLDAAGDDGQP